MRALSSSLFLAGCLAAGSAMAVETLEGKAPPRSFYEETKRGWFWYEKTPLPKKPKGSEATERPPAVPAVPPTARDYTYEQLWNMDPPEFQKIYTNTLNQAVRTLSVQDTEDYYRVQDIARRKAAGFANVAAYVVQTHPEYNVLKDYPQTTPGRRARLVSQQEEVSTVIRSARNDHALLFFYSTTCRFCEEEAEILAQFSQKYRWEIKGVDINQQTELAARFKVETTPTLFMIRRDNPQPFPVAIGVISLIDLEQNLVSGVRMLAGNGNSPVNYSVNDFQRGSTFDPEAELRRSRKQR